MKAFSLYFFFFVSWRRRRSNMAEKTSVYSLFLILPFVVLMTICVTWISDMPYHSWFAVMRECSYFYGHGRQRKYYKCRTDHHHCPLVAKSTRFIINKSTRVSRTPQQNFKLPAIYSIFYRLNYPTGKLYPVDNYPITIPYEDLYPTSKLYLTDIFILQRNYAQRTLS